MSLRNSRADYDHQPCVLIISNCNGNKYESSIRDIKQPQVVIYETDNNDSNIRTCEQREWRGMADS